MVRANTVGKKLWIIVSDVFVEKNEDFRPRSPTNRTRYTPKQRAREISPHSSQRSTTSIKTSSFTGVVIRYPIPQRQTLTNKSVIREGITSTLHWKTTQLLLLEQ